MKIKVVIVILVLACIGLGVALFTTKNQGESQHVVDVNSISDYSNQVVTASHNLTELGQVNLTLSNDLVSSQEQLALTSSQLTDLSNSLAAAHATLNDAKSSLVGAQELVTNLNSRIADLETQNKELDDQTTTLSNTLAQLTAQIETTKNQLAVSQTNSDFLQDELQKQLAQKAELEHKFNDLAELRVQVKKIKDEMFVARRIELMKNDTSNKKGAELLTRHKSSGTNAPAMSSSNYDLNVEVGSDGSVKVIPPLGTTNSPAH